MITDDKILKEIVQFLSDETGVKVNKLTREKELERVLGISGDDTRELLEKFCKVYNIEKNINFEDYVSPEGFGLVDFWSLYNFFRGKKDRRVWKSLTIGDLENARMHKRFVL